MIWNSKGAENLFDLKVRLFNKLLLNLKVLFHEKSLWGQETQSWHRNPFGSNQTSLFAIKRCLRQSQKLRKCRLCLCRYKLLALSSIQEWWLEIFQFPGRPWDIIIGNLIINRIFLFIRFLMSLSFRLNTYSSSYEEMFSVAGTLRIQHDPCKVWTEGLFAVKLLVKNHNLKFYCQQAPWQDKTFFKCDIVHVCDIFLTASSRYLYFSVWLLMYLALLTYVYFYDGDFFI